MNEYQAALLAAALLVAIMSWRPLPRARYLLLMGVLSFVASTAYSRYALPYAPAVALWCDAVVCLWIYYTARDEYELRVWRVFQGMVLVNLLFLVGAVGPHIAYVAALELLNWLALIVIGGAAITERQNGHGGDIGRSWVWLFPSTRGSLRAQRAVAERNKK